MGTSPNLALAVRALSGRQPAVSVSDMMPVVLPRDLPPRRTGSTLFLLLALAVEAAWPAPSRAEHEQRVSGSILSVDADAGEIVLDDAGRRRKFQVGPDISIREKGSDKTMADLHHGDRVVISADGDPPVARRIQVAGPAATPHGGGPVVPGFAAGLDARTTPK